MATATKPKPGEGAALKLTVKDFTGELPKRKGPNERKETPFDALFKTLVEEAAKGKKVGDKTVHESSIKLAACTYNHADDLKPVASMLRSALRFNDPEGVHGLRTWVVDDGMAFQVGPKIVRPPKDKPEGEQSQAA